MPSPKAIEIKLSSAEQEALEKLVRRHKTDQQIAQRARIVLDAAQGKSNSRIVDELSLSMNTVRLWRDRWALLQSIPPGDLTAQERLEDFTSSGSAATNHSRPALSD